MNNEDVVRKINAFPRWHYEFDLKGHRTPIFEKRLINRHAQRRRYFFDPLVDFFGGSLKGKRVLDLGCNAGFWSLAAIEKGCDFVAGIDGRQMHVDQADFVFDVHDVPKSRYRFIRGNIYEMDLTELGEFDVVFCLGLLYHVSKPVELLERISRVNTDALVIDTNLSEWPGSLLEIRKDNLEEPRNAVDYELVTWPTRAAVVDITGLFGYGCIVLKPRFSDYTGADDFRCGKRRAFVCSKRQDLRRFPAPAERADREAWDKGLKWYARSLMPPLLYRLVAGRRNRVGGR